MEPVRVQEKLSRQHPALGFPSITSELPCSTVQAKRVGIN